MNILARPEGPSAHDERPTRRGLAGLAFAGYAAAGLTAAAEPVVTDSAGLVTGRVRLDSGGFALPAYLAKPSGPGRRPAVRRPLGRHHRLPRRVRHHDRGSRASVRTVVR